MQLKNGYRNQRLAKKYVNIQPSKATSAPSGTFAIIPYFVINLSISMTAHITSATTVGFSGQIIEVECDSSKGLPSLQIVGLGNKAIDEAKERVRSAIKNSHLDFPAKKITINLAPADIPKDGAHFDLPIALAIMTVSGQLPSENVSDKLFVGELSLSGTLRPIKGSIHLAETAAKKGIKEIYLPKTNATQASFIKGVSVYGVESLSQLFLHLIGEKKIQPTLFSEQLFTPASYPVSIDDVIGQEVAKRALTIAAAGHHNILLTGPPGTGKTMLAQALLSLLPPLSFSEYIDVMKLHSLSSGNELEVTIQRPFRAPHHTASHISLVGGGTRPLPGEMSLAHHGVLFLDELPEYPRSSLEAMRQPLENREISVARAQAKVTFPANFMLVATQNPCPCGYLGDQTKECSCSQQQILRYQKKVSGPLLDRIDMIIHVGRISHSKLLSKQSVSVSKTTELQEKIVRARSLQEKRFKTTSRTNAMVNSREVKKYFAIKEAARSLLDVAAKNLDLSTRSYFKIIKVARTIADLEEMPEIHTQHISEALQYRKHS